MAYRTNRAFLSWVQGTGSPDITCAITGPVVLRVVSSKKISPHLGSLEGVATGRVELTPQNRIRLRDRRYLAHAPPLFRNQTTKLPQEYLPRLINWLICNCCGCSSAGAHLHY